MMDRSRFSRGATRAASPLAGPALREPVSLEVPVRLQGDSAELATFFEDTHTVLVFPEGAVLRLAGQLHPGQRVLLTNRNTRQQLSCRVVYARPHPGVKGYAEVQFAGAAPGFWEGAVQPAGVIPLAPGRSALPESACPATSLAQVGSLAEPAGASVNDRPVGVAPSRGLVLAPLPPVVDDIEKLLSRRAENEAAAHGARAASAFQDPLLPATKRHTAMPPQRSARIAWITAAVAAGWLLAIGAAGGTRGFREQPAPPIPSVPTPPEWFVAGISYPPEPLGPLPLRTVRSPELVPAALPLATQIAAELRRRIGVGHLSAPAVARRANIEAAALPDTGPDPSTVTSAQGPMLVLVPLVEPHLPAPPVVTESKLKPLRLISSRAPVYPLLARRAGTQGEVVIHARVDEQGNVTLLRVVSGPPVLRQAALDAVHLWKYEPALLNGKPVSVDTAVAVKFQL